MTLAVGVKALQVLSYGYVFYGWGMVLAQAFNGAGDTLTPTKLNFVCFWLLQVPLAWSLAGPADLGPDGVFWSVCTAESVLAVAALLLFRRGTWKRTQLAADRTLLAAERTYAAWVRTGLAALAAGIGAKALLEDLVPMWLVLATSIVLIFFSEFCFVAGVWRELRRAVPPPRVDTPSMPGWLLVVFNGFLVVLGVVVPIGIVTR